jgi:MazG family protein
MGSLVSIQFGSSTANASGGLFAGYSIVMDLKPMEAKNESGMEDDTGPGNARHSAADVAVVPGAGEVFADSVAIMARLRGPDGCPWDREQSFDSIRKHTIEEAYEVLDAIERRDWPHLKEELGDLMLQVLFYAQMGSELPEGQGRFTIADVMATLNQKLIRRHPHVFGEAASAAAGNRAVVDASVDGSADRVMANWEEIKKAEKLQAKVADESFLDQVLRAQPALVEAGKLGSKAAKVGFDWAHWRELLAKLEEETAELVEAAEGNGALRQTEIEAEVGDLLFTAVNLGRHLGVDAELALRGTNSRFRARFREMEIEARTGLGKSLDELKPEQLETLWIHAKRRLARTIPSGEEEAAGK